MNIQALKNKNKFLRFLLNKYVIATLVFLLIILFLDDYNLMVSSRVRRQVKQLHEEEQTLREAIIEDSIRANSLQGNLDAIEHYGRENYYMKRKNEDIYVIEQTSR